MVLLSLQIGIIIACVVNGVHSVCPSGKFGNNCHGTCHCNDGPSVCSQVDGQCMTGHCARGWSTLPTCQTPCSPDTFSINCQLQCHCRIGDSCSPINGICGTGYCSHGWTGPSCQTRMPVFSTPPNVTSVTATSARVSWRKWSPLTDIGEGPVSQYLLQYSTRQGPWHSAAFIHEKPVSTVYSFNKHILDVNTEYTFRVLVYLQEEEKSVASVPGPQTTFIRTLCTEPTEAPANVEAHVVTGDNTMWVITFTRVLKSDSGCNSITKHVVHIKCMTSPSSLCRDQDIDVPWPLATTIISCPSPYTEIHITVTAVNDAGLEGPPSNIIVIVSQNNVNTRSPEITTNTTAPSINGANTTTPTIRVCTTQMDVPATTTNKMPTVWVDNKDSTSLSLKWDSLSADDNSLYKVEIEFMRSFAEDGSSKKSWDQFYSKVNTITIHSLLHASQYAVTISTLGHKTVHTVEGQFWTEHLQPPLPPHFTLLNSTKFTVQIAIWPYIEPTFTGPISAYQIIVDNRDIKPRNSSFNPSLYSELEDYWLAENHTLSTYITAELTPNLSPNGTTFDIGDGNFYGNYFNGPLQPDDKYQIWFCGVSSLGGIHKRQCVKGKIDVTPYDGLVWRDTEELEFGFMVAGLLLLAIILCVLLVLLIRYLWKRYGQMFRRRFRNTRKRYGELPPYPRSQTISEKFANKLEQNTKQNKKTKRLVTASPRSEEWKHYDIIDLDKSGPEIRVPKPRKLPDTSPFKNSYCVIKKSEPVMANDIASYYERRESSSYNFAEEFKHLPMGMLEPIHFATLPENRMFNRSSQVLPYDKNRICLKKTPDMESDYINATNVKTHNGRFYIATQSPLDGTMGEFWRMVWERDISIIVMLMDLHEDGKPEYEQYWPQSDEGSHMYHEIAVSLIRSEETAHYNVRTFHICKADRPNVNRTIIQFQYVKWTKGGVPLHPIPFINFIERANSRTTGGTRRLVHCHTGGGRTGLFIALECLIWDGRVSGQLDVLKCVTVLRQERPNLVKHYKQYLFIYECLMEVFSHSETRVPSNQFRLRVGDLLNTNNNSNEHCSLITTEFEMLNSTMERLKDRSKIWKDSSHFLSPPQKQKTSSAMEIENECGEDSIYRIRFFAIDSYTKLNQFIVTKYPRKNEESVFWNTILEENTRAIVLLSDQAETAYWPAPGKTITFDKYTVHALNTTSNINYMIECRDFKVKGKSDKDHTWSLRIFMLHLWTARRDVPHITSAVDLVLKVMEYSKADENEHPVLVHCLHGPSRSMLFCVLWSLVEQAKAEKVVDVCRTVRFYRTFVPTTVPSPEHYRFLYRAVKEYLKRSDKGETVDDADNATSYDITEVEDQLSQLVGPLQNANNKENRVCYDGNVNNNHMPYIGVGPMRKASNNELLNESNNAINLSDLCDKEEHHHYNSDARVSAAQIKVLSWDTCSDPEGRDSKSSSGNTKKSVAQINVLPKKTIPVSEQSDISWASSKRQLVFQDQTNKANSPQKKRQITKKIEVSPIGGNRVHAKSSKEISITKSGEKYNCENSAGYRKTSNVTLVQGQFQTKINQVLENKFKMVEELSKSDSESSRTVSVKENVPPLNLNINDDQLTVEDLE